MGPPGACGRAAVAWSASTILGSVAARGCGAVASCASSNVGSGSVRGVINRYLYTLYATVCACAVNYRGEYMHSTTCKHVNTTNSLQVELPSTSILIGPMLCGRGGL